MIGARQVIEARLRRVTIDRIDIEVIDDLDHVRGRVPIDASHGPVVAECWVAAREALEAQDLRFVQGIPVMIHAERFDHGYRLLDAAVECGAPWAALVTPDRCVRYDNESGVVEWAL